MYNIAEGFDSQTNPEFVRFLVYAKKSCTEAKSEIYRALDQQYITDAESHNPEPRLPFVGQG